MKHPQLTRKELYDLLWSEPITEVLIKYNLSYHDLREICKTFNIPTPKMRHWGKLKFGKPVQTTSLPEWEGEEPLIRLVSKKSQKPALCVRTAGTAGRNRGIAVYDS